MKHKINQQYRKFTKPTVCFEQVNKFENPLSRERVRKNINLQDQE